MNEPAGKLKLIAILLATLANMAACGGGDTASNPVVEVVTIKKVLQGQSSNDVPSTVALLVNSGIAVLAKKCATLRPEPLPPGQSSTGILSYAVLVDVSATDVQKATSLGYSLFSATDVFPGSIVAC